MNNSCLQCVEAETVLCKEIWEESDYYDQSALFACLRNLCNNLFGLLLSRRSAEKECVHCTYCEMRVLFSDFPNLNSHE